MSTAELKETVDQLAPRGASLAPPLSRLAQRINDPVFLAEMARRNREMDAGNFVTRDDMRTMDVKLRAEGR